MRIGIVSLGVLGGLAAGPGVVSAADVDLSTGSGADYAEFVVHFGDGEAYTFGVTFDAAAESWTGVDLLSFVVAETGGTQYDGDAPGFVLPAGFGDGPELDAVLAFGGLFVDGLGYAGSADAGYGGGDDWWHFWTRDALAAAWVSPETLGLNDVAVSDGVSIGFRYGSAEAPGVVPEPATLALAAGVGVALVLRRR